MRNGGRNRAFFSLLMACALGSACSDDDGSPDGGWGTRDGGAGAPADGMLADGAYLPGALAPSYRLRDFQPKSPRFDQVYGLEVFRGKPLLVALLAGW